VLRLAGKWDDCVDALGLIGQVLDRMVGGKKPAPPEKRKIFSTDPNTCNVTLADLWPTERRKVYSHRI
jgi:hypothetical protein